jgi:hypothetical protein
MIPMIIKAIPAMIFPIIMIFEIDLLKCSFRGTIILCTKNGMKPAIPAITEITVLVCGN